MRGGPSWYTKAYYLWVSLRIYFVLQTLVCVHGQSISGNLDDDVVYEDPFPRESMDSAYNEFPQTYQ